MKTERKPANHTISLSYGLIKGNRIPTLLCSAGIFAVAFVLCIVTAMIDKMRDAAVEKQQDLYGTWQIADFENNITAGTFRDLHQKALVLDKNDNVIGSIGTMPVSFLNENKIDLMDGILPEKENEIAVTLSVLDALGEKYETAQEIELKWKDTAEGIIHTDTFMVCGILPSYDSYWYANGNLFIDIVCSERCTLFKSDTIQRFIYNLTEEQLQQYRNSDSSGFVVNEYAYPEHKDVDYSLTGIYAAFIVFCLFLVLFLNQMYGKSIHRPITILKLLGISKRQLDCILNELIVFIVDIPVLSGMIFSLFASLFLPWKMSEVSVQTTGILCLCMIMFHLISLFQLKRITSNKIHERSRLKRKTFSVVSSLYPKELVFIGLIFMSVSLTITAADWQMLKYKVNKPFVAMNIRAECGMSSNILLKLSTIPYITETASFYLDPYAYHVTSEKMMEDEVLDIVLENPTFLMRYAKGVAGMQMMVIPDLETDIFWEEYALDQAIKEDFITGKGILCYIFGYVKKETGEYDYSYDDNEVYSLEPGNEVMVDETQTELIGTIRRIHPDSLITNNTILMPGTLIVSENFYKRIHSEYNGEITHVNVRLDENTPDAVRRSVSAVAVESGGRLESDTYAIVSQIHSQAVFDKEMILISGVMVILISLLLLMHLEYLKNETERTRIGILRSLGISMKEMERLYLES